MKICRNKQFISFKLCALLRSVMKSPTVPASFCLRCESSLCPACPFRLLLSSQFGCQVNCHSIAVLVFVTLIVLIMAPKLEKSDAGNLDMPKSSCRVLPLREKVKVLYSIRKKNSYAEVVKIYGNNKTFPSKKL